VNFCIFSGRLVDDAEINYTQSGTPVSNFSLAVESGFGDYKRTDFPRFEMWKREKLAQNLLKGKAINVQASFKEDKYTDKEGNPRKNIKFVVHQIEFQQGQKFQNNNFENPHPNSQNCQESSDKSFVSQAKYDQNFIDDAPF